MFLLPFHYCFYIENQTNKKNADLPNVLILLQKNILTLNRIIY